MNHVVFQTLSEKFRYICINLNGNVDISDSFFYGNPLWHRIISFNGNNSNLLNIKNSYFDGVYSSCCIEIKDTKNANILSSKFKRGYSYMNGGGGIRVETSYIYIKDCEFEDNFTNLSGGGIMISNNYFFKAENVQSYNSTSVNTGSFIYTYSTSELKSKAYFFNVKLKGITNQKKVEIGGLVASAEGCSSIYIENFYGENISGGNAIGLFTIEGSGSIELKNIEIHGASSSNIGGVFFNSYNEVPGASFKVFNGIFSDFYQYSEKQSSSFIWTVNNVEILLNKLIYHSSPTQVELNNIIVDNFYSEVPNYLIYGHGYSNKGKKAIESIDSEIAYINSDTKLNIMNSYFYNIYAKKGFKAGSYSNIIISNSEISNNVFEEGFISIDTKIYLYGIYTINNTIFKYNYGYNGVILNINEINYICIVDFNNSTFIGNTASNYGGIVYSNSKLTGYYAFFNHCVFIENKAFLGSISYSLEKLYEPVFTNENELKKIDGTFVTNPTKIKIVSDLSLPLSILSGERLSYQIDLCLINSDVSKLKMEDIIFFSIEISDNYNAAIIGDTVSFCNDNKCSFPPVK
eukprot:jgi/Orpsp1_1/1179300/evm.model.c7180000068816.1